MNDLVEWLKSLSVSEGEGLTRREIVKKTGMSEEWVRDRLIEAKDQGILVVSFSHRLDLIGRKVKTPVYSFKKGEGK